MSSLQGGFDSGAPEKVPDLIRFSPTSPNTHRIGSPPVARDGASRGQRSRTESTESFNMDPQVVITPTYHHICSTLYVALQLHTRHPIS